MSARSFTLHQINIDPESRRALVESNLPTPNYGRAYVNLGECNNVYIILVHKERVEYPKDVIIGKLTGDIGNQNIRLLGVLNGKRKLLRSTAR